MEKEKERKSINPLARVQPVGAEHIPEDEPEEVEKPRKPKSDSLSVFKRKNEWRNNIFRSNMKKEL